MASAALATAQKALETATTAVSEGRVHAAACTIQWTNNNETMKAVKETLNRMFWAIIGLLGTVTAGLIVALAAVLLRVLAKANIL